MCRGAASGEDSRDGVARRDRTGSAPLLHRGDGRCGGGRLGSPGSRPPARCVGPDPDVVDHAADRPGGSMAWPGRLGDPRGGCLARGLHRVRPDHRPVGAAAVRGGRVRSHRGREPVRVHRHVQLLHSHADVGHPGSDPGSDRPQPDRKDAAVGHPIGGGRHLLRLLPGSPELPAALAHRPGLSALRAPRNAAQRRPGLHLRQALRAPQMDADQPQQDPRGVDPGGVDDGRPGLRPVEDRHAKRAPLGSAGGRDHRRHRRPDRRSDDGQRQAQRRGQGLRQAPAGSRRNDRPGQLADGHRSGVRPFHGVLFGGFP